MKMKRQKPTCLEKEGRRDEIQSMDGNESTRLDSIQELGVSSMSVARWMRINKTEENSEISGEAVSEKLVPGSITWNLDASHGWIIE
jgi:hypothetical protein